MPGSANLATVAEIYEAFGRGDVDTILGHMSPHVAWESWSEHTGQRADVPWMRPRTGPDGVAQFFGEVAKLQIHDFRVLDMLAGERQVAVEVYIDAETPEGRRYADEELHLWSFDGEGKVVRMRHYTDTAKHIAAAGKG
jgi:ketosteroid isomerase-like protein